VLLRVVQAHSLLQMGVRGDTLAQPVQGLAQRAVGQQEEGGVVEALGEAEELLPQLPRCLELGPH
jgi:hypothetical protein